MYSFSAFSLPVCEPLALSVILSLRSVATISLLAVAARMLSEESFLPFFFFPPGPLAGGVFDGIEVISSNYLARDFFSVGVKKYLCDLTATLAGKKAWRGYSHKNAGLNKLKRGVLVRE